MTRIRWAIVGMAFLGTTINYVDRANLAVAAPFISDELNLGSFQLGLVLSGFFWTYDTVKEPQRPRPATESIEMPHALQEHQHG